MAWFWGIDSSFDIPDLFVALLYETPDLLVTFLLWCWPLVLSLSMFRVLIFCRSYFVIPISCSSKNSFIGSSDNGISFLYVSLSYSFCSASKLNSSLISLLYWTWTSTGSSLLLEFSCSDCCDGFDVILSSMSSISSDSSLTLSTVCYQCFSFG